MDTLRYEHFIGAAALFGGGYFLLMEIIKTVAQGQIEFDFPQVDTKPDSATTLYGDQPPEEWECTRCGRIYDASVALLCPRCRQDNPWK